MRRTLAALAVAVALVAGGCARESRTTAPPRPERIVSLSPTATEMLFAIGAGKQVVAVDDQSNYPASAPKTKLSGFQPNVEAIAKYRPDLVVFSGETNELGDQLTKVSITSIRQPAAKTLAGTYHQIAELGRATGHTSEASRVIGSMRADIRGILAGAPRFDRAPTYYHELDQTNFTATSKTFIGQAYALLGLRNIADAADEDGTGYPQLSSEYIVDRSPDWIFLADTKCCGQSASTVAKRPGWSGITAGEKGHVVELDDDVASRWGPRVVDLLRTVARALKERSEP